MTPELISGIAGIVLSLLFSYVPGLAPWYDALASTSKRLVMLGLLFVVAAGALAYQCRGDAACYGLEWERFLGAFITALVSNQAAANITPIGGARRLVREKASLKEMAAAPPPEPATPAG